VAKQMFIVLDSRTSHRTS